MPGHMDFVNPSAMGGVVLLSMESPHPPFRSSRVVVVHSRAVYFLPRVTQTQCLDGAEFLCSCSGCGGEVVVLRNIFRVITRSDDRVVVCEEEYVL